MLLIYGSGSLVVGFMAWQFSLNQGFSQPLLQYLPTIPSATLFGLGILTPLFCYQLFCMKKTEFVKYLNWWVIVTFFLAFLPFGPGRIFLRGILFPLIFVVVLQTKDMLATVPSVLLRRVIWILFFSLLCATNIYIMFLRNYAAHTDQAVDIIYVPQEEFSVFTYLNTHTKKNSGVLAGARMSNLTPAYTYNRDSIGNMGSVTDISTQQTNAVVAFYAGQPVTKDYLKKNNISYVLWGPLEQEITYKYARGNITDLNQLYNNLKLVYETKTSKLYQVN